MGYFYNEGPGPHLAKSYSIQFFLAAVGIAAVVVIVFFILFLTGIHTTAKILTKVVRNITRSSVR